MSDEDAPTKHDSFLKRFVIVFGAIVVFLASFSGFAVVLIALGAGPSVPLMAIVGLAYGWALATLIRHWQLRQEELLLVISTTVNAQLPLTHALRAYLKDRPQGLYEFWIAALSHLFVFPLYYWVWHRYFGFDQQVKKLADQLDDGVPLSQALQSWPNVVTHESRVAIAVGEATGQLADALRHTEHRVTLASWTEILSRLAYPALLLLGVGGGSMFFLITTLPRFKRLADEFKMPMPAVTSAFVEFWISISKLGPILIALAILAVPLATLFIVSPSFRWHLPFFGRMYRWDLQGLVLRSLGTLLEMGRSIPDSLVQLLCAGDLPLVINRCLRHALLDVRDGQPLATAMYRAKLLPSSMVPLVKVSEKVKSLPKTLRELGELRGGKALRLARRLSMAIGPLALMLIGAYVCFFALAVMLPLISWMEAMSK